MTANNRSANLRALDPAKDAVVETPVAEAAVEAPAAPASVAAAAAPPKKSAKRFVLPVIGLGLLAAAGWYGYGYWTHGRFMVSTDDAYIQADIAMISPKVSGYVTKVNAKANQPVKKGDVLVTLDNGDYEIAVEQAEAQLASGKLALDRIDAQAAGARAALAQAEAQLSASEAALRGAGIAQKRALDLRSKSVGSDADADNATVALEQAEANRTASLANIEAAKANITLLDAQRKEADSTIRSLELALDKARRDLAFTELKAPYDGVLGNISVQDGDLVSPGQRLGALVPLTELYIDANFKETQLARLTPGSKVHVHVDAYEDSDIVGTVESVAPASGSVFSMLPAENATGNFTKVTQRVPVRIVLPKDVLASGTLKAGLSVVVDVDTRTAGGAAMASAE